MAVTKPIPDGFEMPIPHLTVDGAAEAVEFYKKAFGAEEMFRSPSPDGKRLMHASLRIGKSIIYLCDDFPEMNDGRKSDPKALGGTSVTVHRYVEDVDGTVARAAKAGATVRVEPQNTFWGDRYAVITDPFGHSWSLATHIKDMTPEEIARATKEEFGE